MILQKESIVNYGRICNLKKGDSVDLIDQNHFWLLHSYKFEESYWFEAEEWVCNFIADYGESIFGVAYSILGEDAWALIPYELEKLIA